LDCFQFPEDGTQPPQPPTSNTKTAYKAATPDYWFDSNRLSSIASIDDRSREASLRATNARNRLNAILVKHADDVCVLEKGRLVATESSVNFLLSFLTQAFSGASTIVQGELAKSILSGVATLSSGTQSNVNATFYRNQLIQAINKTLDSERQRIMTQLIANRSLDIDAYTVDEMIVAANSYHQACSFERGLQVLLDAALDRSGADAVLANRSREAAIAELTQYIGSVDREIAKLETAADANKAALEGLRKQRADAWARLNGLIMARSEKLIVNPSAGDTSAPAEDRKPLPLPGSEDTKPAGNTGTNEP
jgi:hypothetical protein